jgi:hypothetical protein
LFKQLARAPADKTLHTYFMWTRITFYIVLLLESHLALGQTNYEKEVKQFLGDILEDSNTYTLQNYYEDSLELSKTAPFDFEYSFLKNHIDTSMSKYMLRTDIGKKHFDTILIVKEPDNFYYENETKQLLKFLSKDLIFDVTNPFSKQTIDESIKAYIQHKNMSLDGFIKAEFVTRNELDLIIKNEDGWSEFYKKYGDGYLKMTIPIFTIDYEYAYFDWSYHCGGLCGYGYSGLYKKQNGKWNPVKVYMKWMS